MLSSLKTGKTDDNVAMIGLDFGSTTSSAMVALAKIGQNSITGRMKFENSRVVYRSEPVFTPFEKFKIDINSLENYLSKWLKESGFACELFFSGGAIVTGIAAKKSNTKAIAGLVRKKIGKTVIATADDPSFESWLAFMGNSFLLSKSMPDIPVINIDIGGGTTNPALGKNGSVKNTGCSFIGARHFQFKPGTRQLTGISYWGMELLDFLSIKKNINEKLLTDEINMIIDFYIKALEALVTGASDFFSQKGLEQYNQVPFIIDPVLTKKPIITFSGGVGELVYKYISGESMPGTTYYGDMGIDIALGIARSRILSYNIRDVVPENLGRATVYGLTLHSTEISGTTVFLSDPGILPLSDIPIVAGISLNANSDVDISEINQVLDMVKKCRHGGCIRIESDPKNKTDEQCMDSEKKSNTSPSQRMANLNKIKKFGASLALGIENLDFKKNSTLILLVDKNFGKTLGNYATRWNTMDVNLVVIDEIPDRDGHFVNIGSIHNSVIPVSFYGIR